MNNLIENRQIRVFISSTFRDMQDERDYLFDHVFPKIRKIAEQRDVRLVEIDLRWGITYEESANGHVMQICFDEIERCRPYFIGILGDRYGWCPDIAEIEKNPDIDTIYPWVKEYISQGKSVTEMEMQFGALCHELQNEQDARAHFYIKANSQSTSEQQIILKEAVRNHTEVPYADYSSVQQLGDLVERHLIELLDELYPLTECSPFASEKSAQKSTLHSASFGIMPKPYVLDKLNNFLLSEKRYCVLHGQENCGKTSTLSYWINKIQKDSDYIIFYYFVGVSPNSTCASYTSFTRNCILKEMNIEKGDKIYDYDFARLCYNACINKKVLFVIDGVDQFEDSYVHPTSYLPFVPKGSKVIISANTQSIKTTDCANVEEPILVEWEHSEEDLDLRFILNCLKGKHPEIEWINEYRRESIYISPLSEQDIKNNIIFYFSQFCKKLTNNQIKSISKDPKSKNANTLASLMSFLRPLHDPNDLEIIIHKYTSISDGISFMDYILSEIEKKYGVDNVTHYLLTLYVSRNGVPEFDLQQICLLPQIEFSPMHFALDLFVKNISGYLKIKNATIRNLIIKRYGSKNIEEIRGKIVDYYLKKDLYTNCIIDEQSKMWIFELPYQCYKLNRLEELYYVVQNPQVCLAQFVCLSWSMPWNYYVGEISTYWDKLLDSKNYSLDVYFSNHSTYIEYSSMALCYICMLSYICIGHDQAIIYIKRSRQIYSSYGHKYDYESLYLMMMLAQLYSESENYLPAKQSLIEALGLCIKIGENKECNNILRNILDDLKNLCEEEEYYDISIQVDKYYKSLHIQDEHIRGYLDNLMTLTDLHRKHNKLEEALDCCFELTEISGRYQNKAVDGFYIMDVNHAFNQFYCAKILQEMNRCKEATDRVKIALSIYNKHQDDSKSNKAILNIDKMSNLCNQLLEQLQNKQK